MKDHLLLECAEQSGSLVQAKASQVQIVMPDGHKTNFLKNLDIFVLTSVLSKQMNQLKKQNSTQPFNLKNIWKEFNNSNVNLDLDLESEGEKDLFISYRSNFKWFSP